MPLKNDPVRKRGRELGYLGSYDPRKVLPNTPKVGEGSCEANAGESMSARRSGRVRDCSR